jgi:hypothetical protein
MRGLAGAVLLAGCQSQQPAPPGETSDVLAAAPADWTIDATVLAGGDVTPAPGTHLRPSRAVVFPDGSLHYGADPKRGVDWLPPLVRRLSREQMAQLWSQANQMGFDDAEGADDVGNEKLIAAGPTEIVHVLSFSGGGQRWAFVRRGSAVEPTDAATTAFIRTLAALAWAEDEPDHEAMIIPLRYDFGPDPYQRFREP